MLHFKLEEILLFNKVIKHLNRFWLGYSKIVMVSEHLLEYTIKFVELMLYSIFIGFLDHGQHITESIMFLKLI